VDVTATCITEGTDGKGFLPEEIDQIVDVVAFVPTVSNTTTSSGGADEEGDDAYRARIRLGVTALSVAGSRDAYEYWARTASAQVSDVHIDSPSPGAVDVYVLLTGGALPDASMLSSVETILSADTVRPLTDLVTAKAPTTTEYTVELTYYIRQSDAVRAAEIQTAVETAVADWILWQRSAIGRDINPSELTARIVNAGAKRVAITTPEYTAIAETAIAVISGDATIVYGGLEDE
jgi:phage-related baseplate assembly protein